MASAQVNVRVPPILAGLAPERAVKPLEAVGVGTAQVAVGISLQLVGHCAGAPVKALPSALHVRETYKVCGRL